MLYNLTSWLFHEVSLIQHTFVFFLIQVQEEDFNENESNETQKTKHVPQWRKQGVSSIFSDCSLDVDT
jgi:hypothetical protein